MVTGSKSLNNQFSTIPAAILSKSYKTYSSGWGLGTWARWGCIGKIEIRLDGWPSRKRPSVAYKCGVIYESVCTRKACGKLCDPSRSNSPAQFEIWNFLKICIWKRIIKIWMKWYLPDEDGWPLEHSPEVSVVGVIVINVGVSAVHDVTGHDARQDGAE